MRPARRSAVFFFFFFCFFSGLAGCEDDGGGTCLTNADCPGGHVCDDALGCVPGEGDGDADADGDGDADGAGDGDADSDGSGDADADADGDADVPPDVCADLAARCADGDPQACAELDTECDGQQGCDQLLEQCLQGGDDACRVLADQCPEQATSCDVLQAMCADGNADACAQAEERGCPNGDGACGADGLCDNQCPDDPDCVDTQCPESCGLMPVPQREHCTWSCDGGVECRIVPLNADGDETCMTPDGQEPRDEDCDGLVDCEDPNCENAEGCR